MHCLYPSLDLIGLLVVLLQLLLPLCIFLLINHLLLLLHVLDLLRVLLIFPLVLFLLLVNKSTPDLLLLGRLDPKVLLSLLLAQLIVVNFLTLFLLFLFLGLILWLGDRVKLSLEHLLQGLG
jgi:hypothetical protein